MEDNNSTMSDYSLIDNHRELTKILSNLEVHTTNCEHSVRFTRDDMCVTDNDDVYFTDIRHKSISCLSPSGSVSTVINTDPLVPLGICQPVDSGLLVTWIDKESDVYKLESHSRRLVRHITVTGEVINEYEDGQPRLFTFPYRVTQNSNSDICVLNRTSDTTGDLVIMSPSGRVKFVYCGKDLTKNFRSTDVVCDSLCNFLVTDLNNKIHLLSPDGEWRERSILTLPIQVYTVDRIH
ncbi:uncharacterized protein LOC133193021 [Saccostrea echinata]|uniref:uncharacterized protein LOC133193021 n=1 Tax=Saccostrea echinata TaxID=191078 RepID=UPI002A7F88D5|nr:uncharacterized protein LOC133193021 [Saccostrea echinata]